MKKLVLLILFLLKFLSSAVGTYLFGFACGLLFMIPVMIVSFDFFKLVLIIDIIVYTLFYEFFLRRTKVEIKRKEFFNYISQVIKDAQNAN